MNTLSADQEGSGFILAEAYDKGSISPCVLPVSLIWVQCVIRRWLTEKVTTGLEEVYLLLVFFWPVVLPVTALTAELVQELQPNVTVAHLSTHLRVTGRCIPIALITGGALCAACTHNRPQLRGIIRYMRSTASSNQGLRLEKDMEVLVQLSQHEANAMCVRNEELTGHITKLFSPGSWPEQLWFIRKHNARRAASSFVFSCDQFSSGKVQVMGRDLQSSPGVGESCQSLTEMSCYLQQCLPPVYQDPISIKCPPMYAARQLPVPTWHSTLCTPQYVTPCIPRQRIMSSSFSEQQCVTKCMPRQQYATKCVPQQCVTQRILQQPCVTRCVTTCVPQQQCATKAVSQQPCVTKCVPQQQCETKCVTACAPQQQCVTKGIPQQQCETRCMTTCVPQQPYPAKGIPQQQCATKCIPQRCVTTYTPQQPCATRCVTTCVPQQRATKCVSHHFVTSCAPQQCATMCIPQQCPTRRVTKCVPQQCDTCVPQQCVTKCVPQQPCATKCIPQQCETTCVPQQKCATKCVPQQQCAPKCVPQQQCATKCVPQQCVTKCGPQKQCGTKCVPQQQCGTKCVPQQQCASECVPQQCVTKCGPQKQCATKCVPQQQCGTKCVPQQQCAPKCVPQQCQSGGVKISSHSKKYCSASKWPW
ncbi:uncharacterized protein O9250_013082 [Rhynochetos jubatus]